MLISKMNPRVLLLCLLVISAGTGYAQISKLTGISKISYKAEPSTYVNKDEKVKITVEVMGKKADGYEWKKIPGDVKITAKPGNVAIPPTVSSGGSFTFPAHEYTRITLSFEGNNDYAGSENAVLIGVPYISSPLLSLSPEFIMLFIILIIALLSYRFFTRGKLDMASWWQEIKGRE